jgi:hypothetical protein
MHRKLYRLIGAFIYNTWIRIIRLPCIAAGSTWEQASEQWFSHSAEARLVGTCRSTSPHLAAGTCASLWFSHAGACIGD